jgi:glutamyl-tRNA synthetase
METDPKRLLLIFALQNAVRYNNVPKAGTVLSTLMGKYPEYRAMAKEISRELPPILAEVESLSPEERRERLQELAPELLGEPGVRRGEKEGLPPLENAEGGVVMRFAPNPSGPLHLGHSRAAYLNDYYVRRYGGRYLLRIEDTDPRRIEEGNYNLVLSDVEWLELSITDIIYQSDRMEIYYDHAHELISKGGAYVCTCDADRFRSLKREGVQCPCRERTIEENLDLWQRMLDGAFYEGMVTVRVKTDLDHPDPAMRDFSIFRIVDTPPHPRVEVHVYPLMNFSVAVDDHLLGVTHVIRGKDHIANTRRQRYLYDYFGWNTPKYIHYGRLSIAGVVLSTSAMKEGIAAGNYSGWDDIRLGTLQAISRRGIQPEAVRNAMIAIGIGETDITFSWENLFAQNKAIIDPVANRYFFVSDPLLCTIEGAPHTNAHPILHPNEPERGSRTLPFTGSVYLPKSDIEAQTFIRLKDLFNVSVTWRGTTPTLSFAGYSLKEARAARAPIIQWLPVEHSMICTLRKPEGDLTGYCEPAVAGEIGRIVQFERVGFARIDHVTGNTVTAYYAHR